MRLVRLSIQRLPGLRPGFSLEDPDPGLNLIVGPNASGKSSVLRGLRYLLSDPRPDDPVALSLEADFRTGEKGWRVVRTASRVVWTREGAPVDPPSLPGPDFHHCYWLTVEDLLRSDHEGDGELVARLRRELTGGYDLDALLEKGGPFRVGARHGRSEAGALREALGRAGRVEDDYRKLQRDRERLPGLERRIAEGEGLGARRERVRAALDLLEARRSRREVEAALEAFPAPPEVMERLRGDEDEALKRLARRREELGEERRTWEERRREAEIAVEAAGLEEGAPGRGPLERHRESLDGARDRLRDRRRAIERRDAARAEVRAAVRRLGAEGLSGGSADAGAGTPDGEIVSGVRVAPDPLDALPTLDPGTISEAEELADTLRGTTVRVRELEARLEGAPEAPDPGRLEAHREAVSALRGWLAAGSSRSGVLLAAAAAAFVTSLGTVGLLVAGRGGSALVAGLVAALAAGGVALVAGAVRQERASARSRFRTVGLEPPGAWTAAGVADRLGALEERLAELRETGVRAARVEGDRERLEEARERLRELETRRREMAARVGFDPERTATSLHEFLRLVDALEEARVETLEADAAIGRAEEEVRERLASVRAFLERYGAAPPEEVEEGHGAGGGREVGEADEVGVDPAAGGRFVLADGLESTGADPTLELRLEGLRAALGELRRRSDAVDEAGRKQAEADRTLARVAEDLERIGREEAEIHERAGLEPGDRAGLERRLGALESFRERREALREVLFEERRLRRNLEGSEEGEALLGRVEAEDGAALRSRLEALEEEAVRLQELREERTRLRTRLEDAGTERELEEATARVGEARAALEEARDRALLAAAGRFLVEDVLEEHRVEHEPDVLRDARERFERFTHRSFSLEFREDRGIAARDLAMDELRSPAELSSGTRMQLLLALRVAWTRTLEEGREPLPLFLDEALTTSDPERFGRVAESLAELVREEGRQVFYLCAQPGDVLLWERALGERPAVIDLAAVRFGRPGPGMGADRYADFTLPEREPLPAPDGASPERYALRLGVPRVDPWGSPESLHPFHLLRDELTVLHRLLEAWRVRALGPLRALLESSAAPHAVPDGELRDRLSARCRVAALWMEIWREGRDRPVDRTVLEASEAVGETFLDRAGELADEVEGDPRRLLERLPELKGWGPVRTANLESWLEEQGHLDRREPLDREAREARVLREAAGLLEPGECAELVRWLEAGTAGD